MQSNVENLGALERRIDISIPQDQVQEEIDKRLKQLAKKVKIHGFRPGKVPLKLVAQRYGAEVHQEVLGDVLNKKFSEAVTEHNLQVVGYPRYETKQNNDSPEQYVFSAQFEIYPEIVVGDLSQLSIEKPVTQVAAENVDKTLEMIRKQHIQYQAADRAVIEGDRVKLDFNGTLDGKDFEGGKGENIYLVAGEGRFIQNFEAALLGMQAGEEKTFDVVFPEDYHGKEIAGKTVVFNVKLKSVELPVLPEINEEFAKRLGIQDGDLEKMRDGIRHDLEREVAKRINTKLKEQAMQCLMDAIPIEAPNALVNQEATRLMENTRKDLTDRGMSAGDVQLTHDMFKNKAEHRIKLGLILAELLKIHQLKATPEQVRKVIEENAQSYENPEEIVKWHYASKERLQDAESLALEANVVQWVLQQVNVVEKPVTFDELMGIA